jgi:glycosyltransferase 2 family protein
MFSFRKYINKERKPAWRILLPLCVSITFILLIYGSIDLDALLEVVRNVSIETVLVISLLYLIGQVLSAVKWRVIFLRVGIVRSIFASITAYFFGMFVNTFGLGTIGGDVVRALAIRPGKGFRTLSLACVITDRIHGLGVLAIIGAVACLIKPPETFPSYSIFVALVVIPCVIIAWFLVPQLTITISLLKNRLGLLAAQFSKTFPMELKSLLLITFISVMFHILQIFINFLISIELATPLSFAFLCVTIPIINIASSLPISVSGVGVREALCVLFFVPAGLSHEQAVAFGAIWIVVVTLTSALAGLVALVVSTWALSSEDSHHKNVEFSQ